MRLFYLVLFMFFSTPLLAQQAGGHPGPGYKKRYIFSETRGDINKKYLMEAGRDYEEYLKQYQEVLKKMNIQWVKCGQQPYNLLEDFYTRLTWLSFNHDRTPNCTSPELIKCLYTPEIKSAIGYFLTVNSAKKFLSYSEDGMKTTYVYDYFMSVSKQGH